MACRNMEVGDIVVVDTSDVNALGIVTEISGDGEKTGGVGMRPKAAGHTEYAYCVASVVPMGRLCRRGRRSGSMTIHGGCTSTARTDMRCRNPIKERVWQGCWRKPAWNAGA